MAGTQVVTILFCDLVSSTERRARLGDDAYDEVNRQLFVVLRNAIGEHGGRETSNAGDGMMVVFPRSAADAVSCATQMQRESAELDADDPLRLRIGISTGEVAEDGENYSGMPIVEAARLQSAAAPGQTLANSVVRTLVGNRRALRFRDVGSLTLKGIPAPLAAVEVVDEEVADIPATQSPRAKDSGPWWIAAALVGAVASAGIIVAIAHGGSHHAHATTPVPVANYSVAYATKTCPAAVTQHTPGITCATLTVPEDRTKPSGRLVKLDVFRAPARGRATDDPVLDFGADDPATSPARDNRELIQLAQRGWSPSPAPASDPALTCPEYSSIARDALTKPSNDPAEQQRDDDALRACYHRLTASGIDLNQYNYLAVGDDMADLIRQLHLAHVNLESGYVDTISALRVAQLLPGVVRSITLQDPVPGGKSANSDPTRILATAFNSYVALCRADASCNASFPDLHRDLRRDYDDYRAHPRLAHGDTGDKKHDVYLDGPRVAWAVFGGLEDTGDYGLLAAGINATNRMGPIDALTAGRVLVAYDSYFHPTFAWGAYLSGLCSYEQYTLDPGRTLSSQAVPELSGVDDGSITRQCNLWTVRNLEDTESNVPSTPVPTLIVSGDLSPDADQTWPEQFQQSMPNATVVHFPTLNENLLNADVPTCLGDLRRQFLTDPHAPLDAEGCARQSPPIHFVASPPH
jgi:class 3 adenylate cyclase